MKELKCQSCGATLSVNVNDHDQAIGECKHCNAQFLLDDKRKQHLILEHRFPDALTKKASTQPTSSILNRRSASIGGAAVVLGLGAFPLLPSKPRSTASTTTGKVAAIAKSI